MSGSTSDREEMIWMTMKSHLTLLELFGTLPWWAHTHPLCYFSPSPSLSARVTTLLQKRKHTTSSQVPQQCCPPSGRAAHPCFVLLPQMQFLRPASCWATCPGQRQGPLLPADVMLMCSVVEREKTLSSQVDCKWREDLCFVFTLKNWPSSSTYDSF